MKPTCVVMVMFPADMASERTLIQFVADTIPRRSARLFVRHSYVITPLWVFRMMVGDFLHPIIIIINRHTNNHENSEESFVVDIVNGMNDSDKQLCTKPERVIAPMQQPITCPAPVLDFLHQKFLDDESTSPLVLHVEEAQSAQQQVLILTLRRDMVYLSQQLNRPNNTDQQTNSPNGGDELLMVRDDHELVVATKEDWKQALSDGDAKLVVRLWKHGSRWWNLHQRTTSEVDSTCDESADEATATLLLAASELAGYRLARRSLPHLRIPRVLATGRRDRKSTYHHDRQPDTHYFAWAIMEYVGETSTLFRSSSSLSSLDDSWTRGMIKVRDEFGFSEPHPRWGRVPTAQALDYAKTVLGQVTIPLHRAMNESRRTGERDDTIRLLSGLSGYQVRASTRKNGEPTSVMTGYTYQTMIKLYQQAYAKMQVTYSQMVKNDEQLLSAIQNLGRALHYLQDEAQSLQPPTLPPVLVHMDCQPQNLLFGTSSSSTSSSNQESSLPRVASVLDWEEAAYADPRFELLMVCRKVVANREQADILWEMYQTEMNDGQAATGSDPSRGGPWPQQLQQQQQLSLGPIEPWLHLETVHSLTTLILQSMDLLGGGRSPWETKPDLWGKIDREFQRLIRSGWELATLSTTT